jgi:glycosyltransferase involved in cell wall biosynthesis
MVSILLATYNGEKYLKKSLDSVLSQNFKKIELLIGFNGTTDNSFEILKNYNDERIRVFNYDDKGKSITLNKLLIEAKFDWIALQDDDDIWKENKLEQQIKLIEKFDVIGTFIDYINENDYITGCPNLSEYNNDIKLRSLNGDNQIANTSAIFKKKDAIDIGGWRDGLDGIEDFDFWLRLIRNGKSFKNIPEKLVLHRLHSNSNFNTKKYDLSKIL